MTEEAMKAEETSTKDAMGTDTTTPPKMEGESSWGSFLSSAWSQTAHKVATGALEAATFLSFATPPDEDDQVEVTKENNDSDVQDPTNKEESQSFLSEAMNRVRMDKDELINSALGFVENATCVIKDRVSHPGSIIQDFNKEQEAFIKEGSRGAEGGVCPWVGYDREDELKAKILNLSEDKRNFLRSPPSGVALDFEYSSSVSAVAMELLDEDPRLKALRYELVPKKIKEDEFWKNYFYRVNLIQQAFDLADIGSKKSKYKKEEVGGGVEKSSAVASTDDDGDHSYGADDNDGDDEFVSDAFVASSKDLAEADESMKRFVNSNDDADLEAELENELQEFEVVKDQNPEWDEQIEKMLQEESK